MLMFQRDRKPAIAATPTFSMICSPAPILMHYGICMAAKAKWKVKESNAVRDPGDQCLRQMIQLKGSEVGHCAFYKTKTMTDVSGQAI